MNTCKRLLPVLLLILLAGPAHAGTFTGRITKISSDGSQITVTSSSKKKSEVFAITGRNLKVSINSKPGKVSQLKEGDIVTVFTSSSGDPQKIYCRQNQAGSSVPATKKKRKPSNQPAEQPEKKSDDTSTWSQFLGPNRENRSSETGLLDTWPASGPKLLWTARNLGEGYSAVSVANGMVFTMGTRAGREIVLAVDLETGRELWATPNGNIYRNNQGNGARSTPTYDNGKLYSLGASGDLSCLLAQTGQKIWNQNILRTYGGDNIQWGISESPLVDGEQVICTPGGSIATMVALNKQTGSPIWLAKAPGTPKAGYASAIIAEIHGVKQYINFCHIGLLSVDADSGKPLWGDDNASNGTANCTSAIVINNTVFYASGYGTGAALLNFNSRDVKELAYKTEKMKNHHGGMVHLNGFIYGANDQILTCLNVQSGAVAWQDRLEGQGKGAITYADGHLYFRSEQGPMFLIEANSEEIKIKSRFDQPERSEKNSWARPVVANGKLFLRDQDILLCYEISK